MAQKYITLSEEALAKMCGLIRDSHSIAEAIDDENIANNSTYSSLKIQELLGEAGATTVELTKAEYDALSDEEKNSETIYFIKDTEVTNEITIVTELDETSTDTQVPSAQTRYDELNTKLNYFTEEHIVGTWLNGKTLYEVTLMLDSPITETNGTAVTQDYDISALGTMTTAFISEVFYNRIGSGGKSTSFYYLPYENPSTGYGLHVGAIKTEPQTLTFWTDDSNFKYGGTIYVTLRYTKD